MKKPNPYRAFIREKLGGYDVAAKTLRTSERAVNMWAHRRAIPKAMWLEIIEAYDSVSLDDLRALESRAA